MALNRSPVIARYVAKAREYTQAARTTARLGGNNRLDWLQARYMMALARQEKGVVSAASRNQSGYTPLFS